MKWTQKQAGFTIIELLIVVVVIAILATITIVAYTGIQDRARSAAFTASLDSLEKKILLQKTETGAFSSTLSPDQNVSNSIGQGNLTQNSCAPGDYPKTDVFKEGECFVLHQVVTYDGDSTPAYELKWSFTENTTFLDTYRSSGLGDIRRLPGGTGFKLAYTQRNQVTAATAAASNYINPRDGWTTVRSMQARRGATFSTTAVSGTVTVVGVTYFLQGDQSCGRGQKALVSLGADVRSIIATSPPGSFVEFATETATQCSLTLR